MLLSGYSDAWAVIMKCVKGFFIFLVLPLYAHCSVLSTSASKIDDLMHQFLQKQSERERVYRLFLNQLIKMRRNLLNDHYFKKGA